MRIIFTTWAWPSHLYAMVPVAWACRAAGHDVLVASQPELTSVIAGTGLPAAPVGRDVDAVATFRDIALAPPQRSAAERQPVLTSASARPAPRPPGPDGGPRPAGGPRVLGLLVELAEAMVDDLIALARGWRADLVVFEPTAFAGPLAAAALRIPAVRHLYGTDLMSVLGQFIPAALSPLREKLGLAEVDPFGVATIDPCPAGLQVSVGSPRLPLRYVPHNGPGALPPPLAAAPAPSGGAAPAARSRRPRVCVTWGTTLSRVDPGLFLAGQVVRAVSGLAVDLVVAITPGQRDLLGRVPAGVRVVESAPLHLLLPRCDIVVAHGGAGTLLTALASGLPQLHIPRLPDHVRHAGRLAEAGAGAVLAAPADDPGEIRDQLAEMLATPGYRAAATRLRDEMGDQPPPASLVRELERLA
jgi:UDP:flavonoid glycosyltransferase YjiC (YdhE family)